MKVELDCKWEVFPFSVSFVIAPRDACSRYCWAWVDLEFMLPSVDDANTISKEFSCYRRPIIFYSPPHQNGDVCAIEGCMSHVGSASL